MRLGKTLEDSFGRKITDLRISLTESCNFRCFYCLPGGSPQFRSRAQSLSQAEIVRAVRAFANLGIRKLRLTGGEPLLYPDLSSLLSSLRCIPGIETIAATTNGSFLRAQASDLFGAGLSSVTVSLDSLRRKRFEEICGKDGLGEVLLGLQAARETGLAVKVNAVLLRNRTEAELFDFVKLADSMDIAVRFIERMPFPESSWSAGEILLAEEARRILREKYELISLPRAADSETSVNFRIPGNRGAIGFIAPVSEPFCESCSRMRLTADGFLRPCLHGDSEFDLKPALQSGDSEELEKKIRLAAWNKPAGHVDWLRGEGLKDTGRTMVRIGG